MPKIYSPSGRPYPDRFPDVDLADPDLPLRIEFSQMCPRRDIFEEKQVNIQVASMRIFLRTKHEGKPKDILLMTLTDCVIRRNHVDSLPYIYPNGQVEQRVTFGRELREAIMRHIAANPFVGKYCRDKMGRGALEQWQTSRASTALMDSLLQNYSKQPSES